MSWEQLVRASMHPTLLKKKNGRTIHVPVKNLSVEDRKFIQDQSQAAFGAAGTEE